MAKRNTGVGKGKKTPPHKTKKRLAVKHAMLALKKLTKTRNKKS